MLSLYCLTSNSGQVETAPGSLSWFPLRGLTVMVCPARSVTELSVSLTKNRQRGTIVAPCLEYAEYGDSPATDVSAIGASPRLTFGEPGLSNSPFYAAPERVALGVWVRSDPSGKHHRSRYREEIVRRQSL